MFSPQIIDSDAFLDMSPSAQNLYFHFGMRADDDGFVSNPKKILRMTGGNEDDYKILLAKRFILYFESGIIVIKHWRINNYIRKDIYEPTKYIEEKDKLLIKPIGSYTFNSEEGVKIPKGHFTLEDIDKIACTSRALPVALGKVRLGKVRLGKVSIYTSNFEVFWNIYPLKVGKGKVFEIWKKINPSKELQNKIMEAVERAKNSRQWKKDGGQYIPHPATWLNQGRWDDELEIYEDKTIK